MDINFDDILNFEALNDNQVNAKKQIIDEIVNYKND